MNDDVLEVVNRIESDLISDRSKIDDIIVRLSTLEERVKTIYNRLPRLEDKQKDATAEMVQPVIDAVDQLKFQVKKKTILKYVIRDGWLSTLVKKLTQKKVIT